MAMECDCDTVTITVRLHHSRVGSFSPRMAYRDGPSPRCPRPRNARDRPRRRGARRRTGSRLLAITTSRMSPRMKTTSPDLFPFRTQFLMPPETALSFYGKAARPGHCRGALRPNPRVRGARSQREGAGAPVVLWTEALRRSRRPADRRAEGGGCAGDSIPGNCRGLQLRRGLRPAVRGTLSPALAVSPAPALVPAGIDFRDRASESGTY